MLAKEQEFIARFAARASHAAQVQSRVKKIEKIERIEIPAEEKAMEFDFPEAIRSGNDVLRIEKAGKTYVLENGKEKNVFHGASATVQRLDKVAVVGVNGAGKSTLLNILSSLLKPSTGSVVFKSKDIYSLKQNQLLKINRMSFYRAFNKFF